MAIKLIMHAGSFCNIEIIPTGDIECETDLRCSRVPVVLGFLTVHENMTGFTVGVGY